MPSWYITHPVSVFKDAAEKKRLAEDITEIYTNAGLPKFYVAIVFIPTANDSFYRGAEEVEANGIPPYIHITFRHIARLMPPGNSDRKRKFMEVIKNVLRPYIQDKGWSYEIDGTETDVHFVRLDDFELPVAGGADEKRWAQENKVSPLTGPILTFD